MKTLASLLIAALLASAFAGCSRHPTTAKTTPQTVTFAGFTNGYVGIAPTFARIGPNYAAAIQQWLADGTNSAMFTITNHQSCDILIEPFGRMLNAGAHPTNETPILNAPNVPASIPTFMGIRLKPGQVSTLQIALLPHQAPWRARFFYIRSDQNVGFAGFTQQLRHLIFRKPNVTPVETIDSDLISQ